MPKNECQTQNYNQQQLTEKNAELEHLDRMKTEFLSNISHELKTPLTVISSYAQWAGNALAGFDPSQHLDTAKLQNYMEIITSEANRLSLMVSQMLDIARIEESRMVIRPYPCSVTEILQNTLSAYFPVYSQNRNRLVYKPPANLPLAYCDPDRITQVIINLIANAAQHTQNGTITIRVYAAKDDGFIAVEVADTGEGMDQEQLAHLFDRYYTRHTLTGTGLGLFICRHIIKEHGGDITAESELGKGATIRFTLPAQK